jgi:hypothetical protein
MHLFSSIPHLHKVARTLSRNTHETEECAQGILSAEKEAYMSVFRIMADHEDVVAHLPR